MGDAWEQLLENRGYKIQHTLGEGAYSKVKSAYSTRLSRDVAIKCINSQVAPKDFVEKFLPRELKTLPQLHHENIVRVYEILEASDGFVYIVMEAARNGDMLRYVQKKGALPEHEIRKYFWQLAQAISYCHNQNICHRDLKCENLLLDKDNKLLLTDFGFSKPMVFERGGRIALSSTFCGSAAYAAPEIIQGRPYDPRMHDLWSMGVVLYIMSCGHMPFDDSNVKKMLKVQLRNHLKFPPRISEHLSPELKNLIRRLIQPDISQRATMQDILNHPFFDGYKEQLSRPGSSVNPTASMAQQILDFFTGRPISRNETEEACCTSGRQHIGRRHTRDRDRAQYIARPCSEDKLRDPAIGQCCGGSSAKDPYDRSRTKKCSRRSQPSPRKNTSDHVED